MDPSSFGILVSTIPPMRQRTMSLYVSILILILVLFSTDRHISHIKDYPDIYGSRTHAQFQLHYVERQEHGHKSQLYR